MEKVTSVLWVTATGAEAAVLGAPVPSDPGYYPDFQSPNSHLLVSGAGMLATAVALTSLLAVEKFDLIIHFGIAGSFRADLPPGSVVQVVSEELGDFGVDNRGEFVPAFELHFAGPDDFPFRQGKLIPEILNGLHINLPQVHGVTVNTVHGAADTIAAFKARSRAEVETMEGAAVFYPAMRFNIPCIQIRAISNFVEPRNRASWEIEKALIALAKTLGDIRAQITG